MEHAVHGPGREAQVRSRRPGGPAKRTGEYANRADNGIETSVQRGDQDALQRLIIPNCEEGFPGVPPKVVVCRVMWTPKTRTRRHGNKEVRTLLHATRQIPEQGLVLFDMLEHIGKQDQIRSGNHLGHSLRGGSAHELDTRVSRPGDGDRFWRRVHPDSAVPVGKSRDVSPRTASDVQYGTGVW